MDNLLLKTHTTEDIDSQIDKILRGLGNPEPPLDLLSVRDLLKLDRGHYSSADTSWLREKASRLKVAGKQILLRPMLLLEAVTKFDLKALYLPDQRRILLDSDLPEKKQRWNEAHEIAHSVLPWHADMMLGDDVYTPTPECHVQIEAEANFAAGRLLFLGKKFEMTARDFAPSIAAVRELQRHFGNSVTTTLWRYIEQAFPTRAVIGVISSHPRRYTSGFNPEKPCRYCIGSLLFQRQFGHIQPTVLWSIITSYCGPQKGGPLGSAEVLLSDVSGVEHRFFFETFYNQYDALTLGLHLGPRPELISTTGRSLSV
jgi:hypothetical protein